MVGIVIRMEEFEMSEFKGTPWPWRVGSKRLVWSGNEDIAQVVCTNGDIAKAMANASLIGSSLELLEALQELLAATEEIGYVHYAPLRAKARAAIAKATQP